MTVDGELAESVADVFARFAPNGVMTEQGVKYNDAVDAGTPTGPITVRAYLEMNDQIKETRQKLEESLYYLGMIRPLPAPTYKQIADQNWMEAWKRHYQPIPIGQRLIIVPVWLDSPLVPVSEANGSNEQFSRFYFYITAALAATRSGRPTIWHALPGSLACV